MLGNAMTEIVNRKLLIDDTPPGECIYSVMALWAGFFIWRII
jgi:hypothetical protein